VDQSNQRSTKRPASSPASSAFHHDRHLRDICVRMKAGPSHIVVTSLCIDSAPPPSALVVMTRPALSVLEDSSDSDHPLSQIFPSQKTNTLASKRDDLDADIARLQDTRKPRVRGRRWHGDQILEVSGKNTIHTSDEVPRASTRGRKRAGRPPRGKRTCH
jgi:hypothetical protein